MVKHQLEEDDKEIEYLEKKLGLGGSDSKNQKEVRRRLNKELKGDGFGDDIMSFLDQMDHVMDETDMDQIRKELSPEEIAKLEEEIKDTKPSKKEKKTKKEKNYAMKMLINNKSVRECMKNADLKILPLHTRLLVLFFRAKSVSLLNIYKLLIKRFL